MNRLLKLLAAIVICELVGITGSAFTVTAISSWYSTLNKPFFSPPNWVFGPVWTTLYFLMAVSVFLVWNKGLKYKGVKDAVIFFAAQLAVNFTWSIVFFALRSPILGLLNILILWALIIATIFKFRKISRLSAYLLVPYLLWVSFAAILNLSIVILNT